MLLHTCESGFQFQSRRRPRAPPPAQDCDHLFNQGQRARNESAIEVPAFLNSRVGIHSPYFAVGWSGWLFSPWSFVRLTATVWTIIMIRTKQTSSVLSGGKLVPWLIINTLFSAPHSLYALARNNEQHIEQNLAAPTRWVFYVDVELLMFVSSPRTRRLLKKEHFVQRIPRAEKKMDYQTCGQKKNIQRWNCFHEAMEYAGAVATDVERWFR